MTSGRRRPGAHLTPPRGWMNDAYGVHWDGTQYHLWYQALPNRTAWAPDCAWGHAVSDDLVTWQPRPTAMVAQPFETGCWSGCVVAGDDGDPRAFYTRVHAADLDLGEVSVARFEAAGRLVSTAQDVVVRAPAGAEVTPAGAGVTPAGAGVTSFRDPYVVRDGEDWLMVVGGGTADGAGAVFGYRSPDLTNWTYTGVLAGGRLDAGARPGRQIWECPQLRQIDGVWVLVISLQVGGMPGPVLAATGELHGGRFTAGQWQPLASGTAPYATSLFVDRDGRAAMLSWLLEHPRLHPEPDGWAGAQSVVASLTVRGTTVLARPHPAIGAAGAFTPAAATALVDAGTAAPTSWSIPFGQALDLDIQVAGRTAVRVRRAAGAAEVVVDRGADGAAVIEPAEAQAPVEVLLDADVLEVFAGGRYGAWRVPPGTQ